MKIQSYSCLKNGYVTKVPGLLEVLTDGFGMTSREIVNTDAIKLNVRTIAICDLKFKFVLLKERKLELLKGIFTSLTFLCYRV